MLNALVNGIVAAIEAQYGDAYPVYRDSVDQGLTEPCFSVRIINPVVQPMLKNRYLRKNLVAVHYFPRNYGDYSEINDVFETLFSILECIEVDGHSTRGTKMEPRIEDQVGIFMVHFDFFVYRDPFGEEKFESLDLEGVDVREE